MNPRPRAAASAAAADESAVDGPGPAGPALHEPTPVTLDIEDLLLWTPEPIAGRHPRRLFSCRPSRLPHLLLVKKLNPDPP